MDLGKRGVFCFTDALNPAQLIELAQRTEARELARQAMAFYLPLTNYRTNWLRLGFSDQDLANGGSDRFLDAMVAWGNETAIRQRIQTHFDAGASHVCIQPLHPDGQSLPDLDALAALTS